MKKMTALVGVLALAAAAFGDSAPTWDYRIEYVSIPSGVYFDTGVAPGERPTAHIACSVTTETIDIFGTPTAKDGCFIYNFDRNYSYLRYGTLGHSGTFGRFEYDDYLEIDVAVETGGSAQVLIDGVASKAVETDGLTFVNETITIPGRRFLGDMKLYSFVLSNGGTNTCEFIPCVKDGAVALYDAVSGRFVTPSLGSAVAGPAVPDSTGTPRVRRPKSVTIPEGGHFDTGYVFSNNPAAEIKVTTPSTVETIALDIFGTKTRQPGCFILDVDHGTYYLRYGTQAHTGGKTPNIAAQTTYVIRMDQTALYVNGEKHSNTSGPTADFARNNETMCFPGKAYAKGEKVWSFKLWDGGTLVRDMIPAITNDAAGFYDFVTEGFFAMSGSGTAVANGSTPEGTYFLGRTRTAASGAGWDEGWSDEISRASSVTVPTNVLSAIGAGETYEIVLGGTYGAGGLACPGSGTLSLAGSGTLTVTDFSTDADLSLALAAGVTVRAKMFARGGAFLPRGLYTAADTDWITGDGQLIVAGGSDRRFPSVPVEPAADGWYEFGKTAAEGGGDGYAAGYKGSTSSRNWIVADWPIWDDYLFPAGAKLRIKGYIIWETIPADIFSEIDVSHLEYALLHGQTAFADGSKLVIPAGAMFRYQPGVWDLDGGKYWLTQSNCEKAYAGDLEMNGQLAIYGDGPQLANQTFSGRLSGTGGFRIYNFSKQGRFSGPFDFTGGWSSMQNGNFFWFDTDTLGGRLTSCTFSPLDGQYGTNAEFCACGILFGRDNCATPADRELSIDTLVGYGRDTTDEPSGKRWRRGGHIIVWGENTVHVGKLTSGVHAVARRQDQNCVNGFCGSCNARGNGHLVVDTLESGTIYGSTNVSLKVGTMAASTAVDYTYQAGNVNRLTLDITNSCDAATTVKATDLAMLPARLSGFAGKVRLTGTETKSYEIPVDLSQGPDALYQTVGCIGSGELDAAPAAGTINATFDTTVEPVRGSYSLARFTSGGEKLAGWTVLLNGASVDSVEIGDRRVRAVKDETGLYLKVVRTGLTLVVR